MQFFERKDCQFAAYIVFADGSIVKGRVEREWSDAAGCVWRRDVYIDPAVGILGYQGPSGYMSFPGGMVHRDFVTANVFSTMTRLAAKRSNASHLRSG